MLSVARTVDVSPFGMVPLHLVKTLRDESGASMKDCKQALVSAGLDVGRARRILAGEEVTAPAPPPAPPQMSAPPVGMFDAPPCGMQAMAVKSAGTPPSNAASSAVGAGGLFSGLTTPPQHAVSDATRALMEMGFEQALAEGALSSSGGDVQKAAEALLGEAAVQGGTVRAAKADLSAPGSGTLFAGMSLSPTSASARARRRTGNHNVILRSGCTDDRM